MDETDLRLLLELMRHCRTPQRELGDRLGLSATAVNKRLASLHETVIQRTTAELHFAALKPTVALLWAPTTLEVTPDLLDTIGAHSTVRTVTHCAGDVLYVTILLPEVTDLEDAVEHIAETLEVPSPRVGFVNTHIPQHFSSSLPEGRMADLDWRLIQALRGDAMRPIAELADAVGRTPKTVGRHLEKLVSTNSIRLTVEVDCRAELFGVLQLRLDEGARKVKLARRLVNEYTPRMLEVATYVDRPLEVYAQCWQPEHRELAGLRAALEAEDGVAHVRVDVALETRTYDTWREAHVDAQVAGA